MIFVRNSQIMEEVEDIVGEVKYTDSQKSVTTSNMYSPDFTDSSSDRNISSGKNTYVIEQTDSDSDKTYHIHRDESILNLHDKVKNQIEREPKNKINQSACTSLQQVAIREDTFTQTSKTIFELRNEISVQSNVEFNNLETQTSFLSVTEKCTLKYTVQSPENKSTRDLKQKPITASEIFQSNKEHNKSNIHNNHGNCEENDINFTNFDTNDVSSELYNETLDKSTDEVESWSPNSDIEEDSLMENEYRESKNNQDNSSEISDTPESVENDIEQLYEQISSNVSYLKMQPMTLLDSNIYNFKVLTPLTEETNKVKSIFDVTPSAETLTTSSNVNEAIESIRNDCKIKNYVRGAKNEYVRTKIRLPPIYRNLSCPSSPDAPPNVFERQQIIFDRWELGSRNLASGESPLINEYNAENAISNFIQLPPIQADVYKNENKTKEVKHSNTVKVTKKENYEEISIKGRIKDLKMSNLKARSKITSRSNSPASDSSPGESKLCDAAEKGCDALCFELLRQLRSCTWTEVAETLAYLPRALKTFWAVISENRIADLLRQLSTLVESPRTQVARLACDAMAEVLKNTNYTKKPDFYEAIANLLTKTCSYNRVVRRAANVGLDVIVCNVDLTHSVTAICVYGVEHKSPLVRCASARLLVVCCALAEGGRQLLKCRPPTAAAARRHVLGALAVLLQDKNLETRKYAERLYAMMRPLPNFEAYFLTDVRVELATEHMKKYDFMLKMKKS